MTIDLRGFRKYIVLGVVFLSMMGGTLAMTARPAAGNDDPSDVPNTCNIPSDVPTETEETEADGAGSEALNVARDAPPAPRLTFAVPPSGLPFSPGNEPVYVTCRFREPTAPQHQGLDFPLEAMTEILSTMTGTVTVAEYDPVYGNLVVVTNPQWETRYAHNAYLLVRKGDAVLPGDVLALSGSTGVSTGEHLHYEIRDALKTARNPEEFLPNVELHILTCNQ